LNLEKQLCRRGQVKRLVERNLRQKRDPHALIQQAAGLVPAVSTRAPYGTLAIKSPEGERQAAAGAKSFETIE